MRLAKFILTFILFVSTFFIVMGAEYIIFRGVTSVGGDSVEVDRVHLFQDEENPQVVSYSDSISFWGTNLQEGVFAGNDYYAIRGWFHWQWWRQGMGWADSAYTATLETVKTIFMPIYLVKEMGTYYGADINDPRIKALFVEKFGTTLEDSYDDLVVMYENGDMTDKRDYDYYKFFYNVEIKLEKYNAEDSEGNPVFEIYVQKFLNEDQTAINATTALLFYQIFLAIVLSMYIVYQNPIHIRRNEFNEGEVEGRALPRSPFRFPKFGRGRERKGRPGRNKRG